MISARTMNPDLNATVMTEQFTTNLVVLKLSFVTAAKRA